MTVNPYLLIEVDDLKDILPVSRNIYEESPFKQCVLEAQESYIRPVITTQLYDDIQTDLNAYYNSATPIPSDNNNLLQVLKPCLAYYALYEYIPFNYTRIREAAIQKQSGDTYEIPAINEIKFLLDKVSASAQRNRIRLIEFLEDNEDTYQLYKDNKTESTKNNNSPYKFWLM